MITSFDGRSISPPHRETVNTPTHLMLSVAALTRRGDDGEPTYVAPAVIGALLPDAPMFVFYAVEKLVAGSTEREIWTERYFMSVWQDFFDLFNSVPIVALGMLVAWMLKRKGWFVLFLSMMLHIACDLPLHHDDGHRHFWPATDWRFVSPVSYWDPRHFGRQAALAEIALFVGSYIYCMIKHTKLSVRLGVTAVALVHLAFFVFAMIFWAGM